MSGSNGHSRDDGVDRHSREKPCLKRTWCILNEGHDGKCVEVPRHKHERPDFGPKRGGKR